MITGKIKQIETMGLMDGPGVRVVIFMQGCPLRCLFCHNPEMWMYNGGISYTKEEVLKTILKYKNYFGSNGGVTFSGGEPLAQPIFLKECLKLCKDNGINTCLDTSGVYNNDFDEELLDYVDLVILDIKALKQEEYNKMTNNDIDKSLKFLKICQTKNKKLWLRSVIVPDLNDNNQYITSLASFIKPLYNVEKVELLPYHTMGIVKYKELGLTYRLANTKAMDVGKCKKLQEKLEILLKS